MALKRRKLIEAREKAHLSQEELAEELETTRVTVSHWENAVTTPYPHHKRKLHARFGIDVEILLAITDEPDGEADGTAEAPPGEAGSCILSQEAPREEMKAGEAFPTNTSTALTPVTHCVWQPPAPTIQNYIASDPARHFWQIAHTDYANPDELTAEIQATIKEMNTMTMGDKITRRDALYELASIPMIALGKTHTLYANRYEEMLRYCAAALEGCWELYRGSDPQGTRHAFDCATTYIPLLETIAHDSSRLRKQALDLATRYALLKTLLGWNCAHPWEAVGYAEHAMSLSKESGNILLQLSAHTKANWTYIRTKQYTRAWGIIQKGELMLEGYQRKKNGPALPSGIIGNFCSSYCQAQVKNGILPDRELDIAAESSPLDEPIAMVEFPADGKFWEIAWICAAKGDPEQATIWLEKLIDTETLAAHQGLPLSESDRIGAINILTDALLQSKERDMGRIIRTWKTSMEGAITLKHEVMYQEAQANFTRMQILWPGEQAIRRLMPLTSHW
jgi:transcriptional regulator with XRE-family HTH domain